MANAKKYIPILISSFISIAAIMFLLALIVPQMFSLLPGAAPSSVSSQNHNDSANVRADSLHSQERSNALVEAAFADSSFLKHETVRAQSAHQHNTNAMVEDSTKNAIHDLAKEGIKLQVPPTSGSDTLNDAERKKMVQIFESMDAESAAKILTNMDDYAFKQVLTAMKKRQSAKILAALEPKQAARILKRKEQR